jgi:hypothetical protein
MWVNFWAGRTGRGKPQGIVRSRNTSLNFRGKCDPFAPLEVVIYWRVVANVPGETVGRRVEGGWGRLGDSPCKDAMRRRLRMQIEEMYEWRDAGS